MKKNQIIAGLLFAAVLLGSVFFYVRLSGGTSAAEPRLGAFFGMPAAMAFVLVLFLALAWVSRKRYPVEGFAETSYFIMLVIVGLLAYFQILVLWTASAPVSDLTSWVMGGIFVALGLVGNVMGKTRRNLALGSRIPWALANERTWILGSRRAGQLMVAVALAGVLLMLLGANKWVLLALIASAIVVLNAYSLHAYRHRREREAE